MRLPPIKRPGQKRKQIIQNHDAKLRSGNDAEMRRPGKLNFQLMPALLFMRLLPLIIAVDEQTHTGPKFRLLALAVLVK